jgi:hypothetical protein
MGYNINWLSFGRIFIPWFMRNDKWKGFIDTLLTPIGDDHAAFVATRDRIVYQMSFNGQIIYLEHVLNDRFDSVQRGIYIENVNSIVGLYIYNKPEIKPKNYIYRKWDSAHAYQVGEYAQHVDGVYRCVQANINSYPTTSNPDWQFYRGRVVIINKSEVYAQDDFIVWVPSNVVFDVNEMKALVNYYRLAGKKYSIQIY